MHRHCEKIPIQPAAGTAEGTAKPLVPQWTINFHPCPALCFCFRHPGCHRQIDVHAIDLEMRDCKAFHTEETRLVLNVFNNDFGIAKRMGRLQIVAYAVEIALRNVYLFAFRQRTIFPAMTEAPNCQQFQRQLGFFWAPPVCRAKYKLIRALGISSWYEPDMQCSFI